MDFMVGGKSEGTPVKTGFKKKEKGLPVDFPN
jgi:hypothetical protein